MSTFNGLRRRLSAAKSALKGDYVVMSDNSVKSVLPKNKLYKNAKTQAVASIDEDAYDANKVLTVKIPIIIDDTSRTIEALHPQYCCGCSACSNVCPVNAITMGKDDEGFFKPFVDHKKCINCGKCRNTCPVMNTNYKNKDNPACYAVMADDETRTKSSSGGAFTLIANYIFSKGGYVCGVVLDENFLPKHIVTNNPADLERMRGSKYVQSNVGDCFTQVKKLLDDEKLVLFTGTPCQVGGLKNFLGKKYDNLYVVDLVCHGAPSQKVFTQYIEETYGKENMADFKFRTKDFGYSSFNQIAYLKDGTKIAKNKKNDPFEQAMHSGLALKQVCCDCMFAPSPRQGDISIGDFWGIKKFNKDYGDDLGTSCMLVNNKHGAQLFEAIKSNMKLVEEVPFDFARHNNRFGRNMKSSNDGRRWLYSEMGYQPFKKIVDYSINKRYDVGIIGLWYGRNYGSMATYYALHQVLVNHFHRSVLMIENPLRPKREPVFSKTHPRRMAAEFYDVSDQYNLAHLRMLNEVCDSFIVGSDQLWNVGLSRPYGQMYFLDFVNDNHKKIAYATSFGKEYHGTREERIESSKNLKRFNHVSVRDSFSKEIAQNQFGVRNVVQTCDPTLLVDRKEYQQLIDRADINAEDIQEPYILAYILDPNEDVGRELEKLAKAKNCKVYLMLDEVPWLRDENFAKMGLSEDSPVVLTRGVAIYEWMWYYSHAQSVVTDSFHGTIFSVVFEKPFITKINKKRGGGRFTSLLEPLGLDNRLIDEIDQLEQRYGDLDGLDYTEPNKKLAEIRNASLEWLGNALNEDEPLNVVREKKRLSDFTKELSDREKQIVINDDVTVKALNPEYCCGCGACFNSCPTDAIKMEKNDRGFFHPVIDNEKCISCGKCHNVCPVMNTKHENNYCPPCYAVMADDEIRKQSSSGGAFTLIANHVFAKGGYVCGAVLNDDLMPEHIVTNDPKDLERMRGSKYVQSNTNNCYTKVKELLDENKQVLFTGTPCQVAGLKGFLGKNYDNLLVVDLVCHGGPSQKVFAKYLDETYGKENIADFKFRTKEFGYSSFNQTAYMKDGKKISSNFTFDPFEKTMHSGLGLQKVCGDCMFAPAPRQGDLTIGDFWGIAKYRDGEFNDNIGTSCVLVNNEKGKEVFEAIRENMKLCESVPFDFARRNNRFGRNMKIPEGKKWFYKLLDAQPFAKLVDYSLNRKFDVAVMGLWYGCNFGGVSSYYALNRMLVDMGLSVLMIDKPGGYPGDFELNFTHARRFAMEHYDMSKIYKISELKELNQSVDTFIVGSEQTWNRGVNRPFGNAYYLDFAEPSKKIISYGASFGHNGEFSTDRERIIIKGALNRFDGISVADDDGVKICKDVFDADAVQVLDPVMACDVKYFDELADQSKSKSVTAQNEKYMCVYILDFDEDKKQAVKWLSEKLGLKVISIVDGYPPFRGELEQFGEVPENVQTEEFIYYIKNAEFVITDEIYGVYFSLIYGKNFIGISNNFRGVSRFESVSRMFELENIVPDAKAVTGNENLLKPLNYDKINEILENQREFSGKWLHDQIFNPKKMTKEKVYDVIYNDGNKE